MRKIGLICIVLIAACNLSFGQVYMNSAGASVSSQGMSLSYSIGQLGTPIVYQKKKSKVEEEGTNPVLRITNVKGKVYPNPAHERVQLEFVATGKQYNVRIVDMLGKEYTNQVQWNVSNLGELWYFDLNIAHLPSTNYVIFVVDKQGHKYGTGWKFHKQ